VPSSHHLDFDPAYTNLRGIHPRIASRENLGFSLVGLDLGNASTAPAQIGEARPLGLTGTGPQVRMSAKPRTRETAPCTPAHNPDSPTTTTTVRAR
jgi:hypothetical protein